MALLDLFKKQPEKEASPQGTTKTKKGWYEDRYQTLIIQRNLFFVLSALCIGLIGVSVVVIGGVVAKKQVEPMVVEVEELSGITTIVNPATDKKWSVSKVINQYFLTTYLRARESYDVASYLYNYNTVVRLLSSPIVYRQFKEIVNDPTKSSISLYGSTNTTSIEIRSILFLTDNPGGGQTAQIRFTIVENQGQRRRLNRIASIVWDYVEMELNFNDMMVNPLGFQIQFYSVSNDVQA
jgi:type IV secretion system protein VirB8